MTDVDVLIIGAGLSGIGTAHELVATFPGRTFAVLEARDAIGGTWDLFRYPGVRSDSDMHTLGYRFRPWTGEKAITSGESIRDYVRDTAADGGVLEHIRFNTKVAGADWSSETQTWTVTTTDTVTGASGEVTAKFVFSCTGYYRYDEGFTPDFAGTEDFAGQIVHPQHWPADLDHAGKKVVVIGSGATAVTLVPTMAETAEHVTMLQRSPSYIVSRPSTDTLAHTIHKVLPSRAAHTVVRAKNIALFTASYQLMRRRPDFARKLLRKGQAMQLPKDFDFETHLTPKYNPWDQRLCLVPDGDLFRSIRKGTSSIVTDRIATFTKKGLLLESGTELEADIIVTATGLNLLLLGGMDLSVDGRPVVPSETLVYKGIMLSEVPNFAFAVGYTNASWTLKVDLTCEYVWRLFKHMDARKLSVCMPSAKGKTLESRPFLDFQANYVLRSLDAFPKQGTVNPWQLKMNYVLDMLALRFGSITDDAMTFSGPKAKQKETVGA